MAPDPRSSGGNPPLSSPTLLVAEPYPPRQPVYDLIQNEICSSKRTRPARSRPVEYSLFGKALSDPFGILTDIKDRMTRGLGLVVISGDMVEGTIRARLLAQIDPTLANKCLANPRRLPTTDEFARVVLDTQCAISSTVKLSFIFL
jgi:hypothetical protein